MTTTVTGGSLKPRPANQLISAVARSVGKEKSPPVRAEAKEYLNEVIDDLNTYQPWEMLRVVDTDTAFVADTPDYVLTSLAYKIEKVQVVDATSGAPSWTVDEFDAMVYKDWDEFEEVAEARVYYARNLHADNKISFKGNPSASLVSSSKFRVQYIKRIPQIADASAVLDIPKEMEQALLHGGRWLMRDNTTTTDARTIERSLAVYEKAKSRLITNDRNHPNLRPRWRLRGGISPVNRKFFRISLT